MVSNRMMTETGIEDAEAVVSHFNAPSQYLPGRTEENHEELQSG
jgi:hypothetical protein